MKIFYKVSFTQEYIYNEIPEWARDENGNINGEKVREEIIDGEKKFVVTGTKNYIQQDVVKAMNALQSLQEKHPEARLYTMRIEDDIVAKIEAKKAEIDAIKEAIKAELTPEELKTVNVNEYWNRVNLIQALL